ncbi:MAG: aminotransferase class IV [Arachnia sp.]
MAVLMVALLDGTIIDPAQPIVRADDQGVIRGDGVFDALLAIRGQARDLDLHLERLARSAAMLDLPAPKEDGYRRAVDALLGAWDWATYPEAMFRFILTRGPEGISDKPGGWVAAAPLDEASRRQRAGGVAVMLLDRGFEGPEIAHLPWLLPGAKSLSYGINMAAKRYAAARGADDVVFHSPSGRLLEGPMASVVLDLDGVLATPPFEGILRSITIEELISRAPAAGIEAQFRELHRDDFDRCRGAWMLSSSRVVARISHVDGRELPTSPLDAEVRRLMDVPGE